MKLETVKIKHPDGYSLINKTDFDKSIHELFEESNQTISEEKKINLNTADKKTLVSLPGIGAKTADEIMETRPFKSLEDAIAQFKVLEGLSVEVK
ncbi:MAG: helix-hairpin-helix domain-containing protein [Xenococcaceae cyanobacterium MO_207.B15]|nr:helix-hairpin-helix domain-containing protein [Xenococcaceae cyanobacterium MO_207.B15]